MALRPLASSSRIVRPLTRAYAVGNPHAEAGDARLDVLRSTLYPSETVAPSSASPVGARHPKHLARLQAVIPSEEAHETVERAYALLRREERETRERKLKAKYDAMVDACEELDRLSAAGGISRAAYDRAMIRMAHGAAAHQAGRQGAAQGKKKTAESRFIEGRPEGLIPREAWVPVETRGKGWNYDWQRPPNKW